MGICNRSCDLCNLKLHCQGCSLCEKVFCSKDCNRCFSLCPDRPSSFAYLKGLGGGEILLNKNKCNGLPKHIPVIPDRLTEPMNIRNLIGVHGGKFLTSNGENVAKVFRERGLKRALNLGNEAQGVLQFYVKDRVLEGFWDNRKEIYRQLLEFPWKAVISLNFSVYEDAPRIDHLYNMKRSNIVYNELLEAGLPAIPDISWYNRVDLDQWIKEINKKDLKCIAFSFQTVGVRTKASNTYLHYMMGYKYLIDRISKDVEIVTAGIVSPKRVAMLKRETLQDIKIINQSAYVQSRSGILSETGKAAPETLSKNQILMRNIEFYDQEYSYDNKSNLL